MSNVKGPLIDGFAIHCGECDRVITLKDDIYTIGCWQGTYDETAEAIDAEYKGAARDEYIAKLNEAIDMLWLTDELHEQLKDDKDLSIRKALAAYTDKHHHQYKDDPCYEVREIVAKYSDKYHYKLKDDPSWSVRLAVAKYSDRYHEQLKDDPDRVVRKAVAKYNNKKKNKNT